MNHRNLLSPPQFPTPWASDWGEDRYGLWMAFTYQGVRQVLRWIVPDSFMMGSPDDEKGRYEDEELHPVTFAHGFWLADTPTTQALWQAVMGDNPSHFKGESLPVEQASWDDVQTFIKRFNALNADLQIRLPTEAEWEYACRAGTQTAFSWGGDISLAQANYRGTWDDWEKWGEGAKQATTPVKSYPANAWGLHDMYGNVWEWCQDWYGGYPTGLQLDPSGADTGGLRVLRGGSWFDFGRLYRSAYRGRGTPDVRYYYVGFRFALGHVLSPHPQPFPRRG